MDGESLRLLLLSAQDMNTPHVTLRADIDVRVKTHKDRRTTQAVAFFAPGKDARWYLQVKEPPLQALVLGSERRVMQRVGDKKAETVPIGAPLDAFGIAYEDLSRFVVDDFTFWQITDESPDSVLAGAHPDVESAYVYRAYNFEKERTIPLRVQFYAKTLNNLIKLRQDDDHQLIGKKWFPGNIRIENFDENSTVDLRIRWSQNASAPPELLAPASFAGTPPLPWPAADASPSPAPSP